MTAFFYGIDFLCNISYLYALTIPLVVHLKVGHNYQYFKVYIHSIFNRMKIILFLIFNVDAL